MWWHLDQQSMRMLGRLACRCVAPGPSRGLGLYPVHTARDQGDGSAHPWGPEPRVPPALLAARSEGGVEPWRFSSWRSMNTPQWNNCQSSWLSVVVLAGVYPSCGMQHQVPTQLQCTPLCPICVWGGQASISCSSAPLTCPGRDLPCQQQAGTELMLNDGVTLSGAAIEVSPSKDTLVAVVFSLGQAAPSCISNTSWGFYPSQWDCLNSKGLLDTGRGGMI